MFEPGELLDVMGACASRCALERSMALWHATCPQTALGELWAAPVGCRDRALLDLRAEQIGDRLELEDRCPACKEPIEFEVRVQRLRVGEPTLANPSFCVEVEGHTLTLRRVTCEDLRDGEVRDVLAGCVVTPDIALSPEQRVMVDAALAQRDPQADISFALQCPCCQHAWSAVLDIGEVLWSELDQLCQSLLYEVHTLAQVYHWSEAEILRMPAGRRRRYLEMVTA